MDRCPWQILSGYVIDTRLNQSILINRQFISVYKTPGLTSGRGQNIFNCKYTSPPPPGKVCDVNIKDFSHCTQENHYSYHKSSPCIFLKLNKIYGWVPEYYNDTSTLPKEMPQSLVEEIYNTSKTNPTEVSGDGSCHNGRWTNEIFSFRWTQCGCLVKAKIQPILNMLAQLNIIHAKDFQDIIIHTKTQKAIWVHWWPSISLVQFVSIFRCGGSWGHSEWKL